MLASTFYLVEGFWYKSEKFELTLTLCGENQFDHTIEKMITGFYHFLPKTGLAKI